MKKILVMGGTGAMGKYLVPMLAAEDGYQVFVTSRSTRQSHLPNLIYLKGNAKSLPWIETILQTFEFDIVFDFMMYGGNEFEDRCSFLLKNCGHYFYLSSYRVLGEGPVLTEDSPVKSDLVAQHPEYAIDGYGLRKAREERALHQSGCSNFTIIRPSMTFSNDRFQYFAGDNFDVIRAAKGVPTLLPESAVNSITNLTYGKSVARMLKALVDNPPEGGQTYHTVTRSMTWGEITEAFRKVFGLTHKIVPDAEYLSLIDLEDGRILDRFRGRNISNKKILAQTGLSDDDFGTFEENLLDAWNDSKRDRYIASRASIGAMARFDHATGSQIDLQPLDDKSRLAYLHSKEDISQRLRIGTFWVRPNPAYWVVSRSSTNSDHLAVQRNDQPVASNAWLNFRDFRFLRELKEGRKYKIAVEISSDSEFILKPFLHLFGREIMRLGSFPIKRGANRLDIMFQPKLRLYSDVAITATELTEEVIFEIHRLDFEFLERQ